ncbi:MAG: pyrroline-5-carboxylate reductase [Coriobacteriia bacterium]|nr:pyrroline-5-carboxylate reductase [Coriobacteriia bacterium]
MKDDIALRLGTIALIGGGRMGEAIVSGLVNGALFDPDSIIIAETMEERREYLEATYGVACVDDGARIKHPTTCLIAVKPQVFKSVAAHLVASESFDPLRVISIAAGITTATIQEFFPKAAVIRVMPNTPLMVSAGMSAVATAEGTLPSEGELVRELFSLIGEAVVLDESLINAATAINGSGPAYFARFVLELACAGVRVGLDPTDSLLLARQTMAGTARLLEFGDMSPEALIAAVASPGGTTEAALASFNETGLAQTIDSAVQAAVKRAEELA